MGMLCLLDRLTFSSLCNVPFCPVNFLALKSTLSDIYVATSTFKKFIFAWYVFSKLLLLPVPLNLKWSSYKQHKVVWCFYIHSAKLWSSHMPTPELILAQENIMVWLARAGSQVWLHLYHLNQERESAVGFQRKRADSRTEGGWLFLPCLSHWPGTSMSSHSGRQSCHPAPPPSTACRLGWVLEAPLRVCPTASSSLELVAPTESDSTPALYSEPRARERQRRPIHLKSPEITLLCQIIR